MWPLELVVLGFNVTLTAKVIWWSVTPEVFFTKKVTPIIGVFPSVNFPQAKYFSPSNHFFPKKPIFPTLIQKVLLRDLVNRPTPSPKDQLQYRPRCMYLTFSLFNRSHLRGSRKIVTDRPISFPIFLLVRNFPNTLAVRYE